MQWILKYFLKVIALINNSRKVLVIMKSFLRIKSKYTSVVSAIMVTAMVITALVMLSACGSKNADKMVNNIIISGVDVSSMTQEQAIKILTEKTAFSKDVVLNFECEGKSFSVSAEEINLKANVEATVKNAFKKAKTSNASENKKPFEVNVGYTFDNEKFLLISGEHLADKIVDSSPMLVEIGSDCLVVTNAIPGKNVDIEKAKKAISEELSDFNADGIILLEITDTKEKNLTFEEFKAKYLREAKDAVYTKTGDSHNIEPEVVGIEFDEDEAKKILEENSDSTESYTIPATITYPLVTARTLEDKYINKIIATFSTSFAGSSAGRCANIALATSKINGVVLNPGERFSYNDVVGPRTEAAGFKMAHVYVGNQVVDGIGGGICQVSSTLYNAVVLADLKTVSRTNHSMPVSYVPMGRDATVAYGVIDYIFENDKSYPVSIKAYIEGTTLTVSIIGSSEMDYTVEFVSAYVSSIPFGTVNVDDPTLPEGEQKIISNGSNGSVYDSYRVYKRNGAEFDRKFESKSRYQPTAQTVAVGTMPPEETAVVPENTENNDVNEAPQSETTGNTPDQVTDNIPEQTTGLPEVTEDNNSIVPETETVVPDSSVPAETQPNDGQAQQPVLPAVTELPESDKSQIE